MIKRLILRNFKSVESAAIDLSSFTFLIGRNGSGKSNIADALAFLSEITEWPLQTVFNRRGGAFGVAHRTSHTSPQSVHSKPIEFGIGLEFVEQGGWTENFDREDVSGRYSFLVEVGRLGFKVVREQCIIVRPNGEKVWFDRSGSKTHSSVEFLHENRLSFVLPDALVLPFAGSMPQFRAAVDAMKSMAVYSIDPGKLREFQDPDAGKRLNSDGSNAASVLRELKSESTQFRRLFEILSSVIPDLERVHPQTIGRKQHLRFIQQWSERERVVFDAFNMSDGTLRAFGILLALFQSERPDLLLIEEPETSLHPAATAAVVEALRQESRKCQIIVSTHSPEVIDSAIPRKDDFRIVTWRRGQTKIGNVVGAARSSLQQHLASAGELFKLNLLDAPPLFEESEKSTQGQLFEDFE